MKTPDITPTQIAAGVQAVAAFLAVLGLELSVDLQNTLVIMLTGLSSFIGGVLVLADAIIRKGRAENADKIAATQPIDP